MKKITMGRIKHSLPTILTVMAAIECAGSVLSAIHDTPKALKLIEEEESARGKTLDNIEKVKVALPAYVPTIVATAGTITTIFGANICNKRQQASLMCAYSALRESYKKYQRTAMQCFGETADEQISDQIARNTYINERCPKPTKKNTFIFYDEYSDRFFERTLLEVQNAEYHLNRNFAIRGYAELNEYYEFLGLEPTEFGATVGWSSGMYEFYGYSFIDFIHEEVSEIDGTFIAIRMPFPPVPEFMDY